MNNIHSLILVTNDDGIASPGLHAAAAAMEKLGEVLIVAPERQQSGMGRSMPPGYEGRITRRALALNGRTVEAYAVDGSPAQAVLHAIVELAPRKPDLVVSGINYGENVGSGITVSGTVGAAMEGADWGIPAIAFSLQTPPEYYLSHSGDVDTRAAAYWLAFFARRILSEGLPRGVDLLKIDVPQSATPATHWRYTRSSRQRYFCPIKPQRASLDGPGPMGYEIRYDLDTLEKDGDIRAVMVDRVIAVTPLTLDLTARME